MIDKKNNNINCKSNYLRLDHTRTGGVGFIFIVATVIVAVAQPSQGDTAVVLAFETVGWAGVLVCRKKIESKLFKMGFNYCSLIFLKLVNLINYAAML